MKGNPQYSCELTCQAKRGKKIWNKEIPTNCSINNFSHHYKKKPTHFDFKKALKNTFPGKKNTTLKKSTTEHFCFLKTLTGRTVFICRGGKLFEQCVFLVMVREGYCSHLKSFLLFFEHITVIKFFISFSI